jgi:hypothetical protein
MRARCCSGTVSIERLDFWFRCRARPFEAFWEFSFTATVVLMWLMSGSSSFAQGVIERPRPDYDPLGIPIGAFRLFPSVALGTSFDDNTYRTPSGIQSDVFLEISPALLIKSNWSEHMLNFEALLRHYQYSRLSEESHTDWAVSATGRLDVQRGIALTGQANYLATHEPRTSPDQPESAAKPTAYRMTHAETGLTLSPFRVGLEAGIAIDRYNFDLTPLIGGGRLDNHDRDRDAWQTFVRAIYEVSPGYAGFLRASFDQRTFDIKKDRTGLDRNSQGERLDAGLDLDITRLVHGEISVGHWHQEYNAPLPDVSVFDYSGALEWYVTTLVTLHFNASRVLNDTTIFGASASDDQHIGTSVDYELLRNLIIQAAVSRTVSDFRGSSREDRYFDASIGFNYLMNRSLAVRATYVHSARSSNAPGQEFHDDLISLQLISHL